MLDQIPLQLEQGGDKRFREDDERGWGGHCSRESFIKIFSSKEGDYSREAINRETAIIQGNSVYIWLTHVSHHVSVYFMITGHLHDGVILLL